MKKLLIIMSLFFCLSVQAADIEGTHALLRGVDKITGHTATSLIPVGEPILFNNMRITAERCLKKPPEETPENAVFLLIEEEKDKAYQVVFKGWMFSSNPALSAMEHPIFDIWLLSCEEKQEESAPLISEQKPENSTVLIEDLPSVQTDSEKDLLKLEANQSLHSD